MKNIADINNMDSRTDLALEVKESYSGSNVEIEGVEVIEKRYDSYDLKVTKVNIFSNKMLLIVLTLVFGVSFV